MANSWGVQPNDENILEVHLTLMSEDPSSNVIGVGIVFLPS